MGKDIYFNKAHSFEVINLDNESPKKLGIYKDFIKVYTDFIEPYLFNGDRDLKYVVRIIGDRGKEFLWDPLNTGKNSNSFLHYGIKVSDSSFPSKVDSAIEKVNKQNKELKDLKKKYSTYYYHSKQVKVNYNEVSNTELDHLKKVTSKLGKAISMKTALFKNKIFCYQTVSSFPIKRIHYDYYFIDKVIPYEDKSKSLNLSSFKVISRYHSDLGHVPYFINTKLNILIN